MKKLLLILISMASLPLLGRAVILSQMQGQSIVNRARKSTDIKQLEGFIRELQQKGGGKFGQHIQEVQKQIQKAKAIKITPVKPTPKPTQTGPPEPPPGAFETKPIGPPRMTIPVKPGPPPIPEGALDILPPIQGPQVVAPPAAVIPPSVVVPPAVVIPPGVKPAGPPAARPPAVTGRDALLKAIEAGRKLRKPVIPTEPKPTDEEDALLRAIEAGMKLRPASERQLKPIKVPTDITGSLQEALAKRRGSIEVEEEDEEDEEWE